MAGVRVVEVTLGPIEWEEDMREWYSIESGVVSR
jgi:hypothetical protein